MHADADHMWERFEGRRTLQQIFVPISDGPFGRRGGRDAGQRERRRQDVLPETGMRIFGIKRVDEQRVTSLYRFCFSIVIEWRRNTHRSREPVGRHESPRYAQV